MATYRLSSKAERELEKIYAYSVDNFGVRTAKDYVAGLHERLKLLAEHPAWGRDYDHIERGLRRYEHQSHSIYYLTDDDGVFIVRVLGARQDPARNL